MATAKKLIIYHKKTTSKREENNKNRIESYYISSIIFDIIGITIHTGISIKGRAGGRFEWVYGYCNLSRKRGSN